MLPCKLATLCSVLIFICEFLKGADGFEEPLVTHTEPMVTTESADDAAGIIGEGHGVDNAVVIELNHDNVDHVRESFEFVLILFYVQWCRFSVAMLPTFDLLNTKLANELPEHEKVAITKIDCDDHEKVCEDYNIIKYPTIKVVRHGSVEKLEYRKERTVEALLNYVKGEMEDPTFVVTEEEAQTFVEPETRRVIGYLSKSRPEDQKIFRKAATHFKTMCRFLLHLRNDDSPPQIIFRPDPKSPEIEFAEMSHNGSFTFAELRDWANYKCVQYVREITFDNAEEITEEGLPLFILFYHPENDSELVKKFKHVVATHFVDDIMERKINFVTANGIVFGHPMLHLGKTTADLPFAAIDSLKHMFSFPHDAEEILNLERVHRFLQDFYSEKLHWNFHNMLAPEESIVDEHAEEGTHSPDGEISTTSPGTPTVILLPVGNSSEDAVPVQVHQSDFVKLYPSELRYTLKRKRDEL